MSLLDGNSALLVAFFVSAELGIAAAITPKFVLWSIKRNLPKLLEELSEDKVLFEKIRNKFMGGIFGLFGGRPPSWGNLARLAIANGLQKLMENNPLSTLQEGVKVTQAIKEAAK